MVSVADVMVGTTTDQQARAVPVAVPDGDFPFHVVGEITVGSYLFVMRDVMFGRASSFLAAAGDAILGERMFDRELGEGIREARAQRQ